ncbi:hypothetical protein V9T40_005924 [Parthenolecanium corni]|uniref:RNA-binding protein spenito n=1 Tax=Parthenolecanium corni TaxID=536013 RepID=A0AAN9TV27_9HEMI
MKRSNSRSSSRSRRKRRSSYGRFASPSPERGYRRTRSPSTSRSRSRRHYADSERYSPPVSKARQAYKVLCVSALHSDASDEAIKDIIYSEYKRFGEFVVKISHDSNERVAYICFRNADDAKEAMSGKRRILIYDKVAIVEPVYDKPRHLEDRNHRGRSNSRSPPDYDRYYRRLPPPLAGAAVDPARFYDRLPPYVPLPIVHPDYRREMMPLPGPPEYMPLPHMVHPFPPPVYGPRPFAPYPGVPYHTPAFHEPKKFPNYLHHIPPEEDVLATRTLFAGNLEIGTSKEDLRRIFAPYGDIEDIDVKRPIGGHGTAYAFVRFKNLDMAHKAKVELSGKFFGKFQLKIGYGKATPTTRIWVGGLGPWTSASQLEREFDRFGAIKKVDYDKDENCAYIQYDSIDAATSAVKEMRGFPLGEHKLRVDFADVGGSSPRSDDERRSRYRRSRSHCNGSISDDERDYEKRRRRRSSAESTQTLSEVAHGCEQTWDGAFVLKNSLFPVRFHMTDGNADVIGDVLDHEPKHMLRIVQRLHLNPSKLADVSKQIASTESFAIFVALPSSSAKLSFDDEDSAQLQTKSIVNLISYLKQKEAAGVLSLVKGALYAFPPCSFATDLLRRKASNVSEESLKKDHLVIVVIKGNNDAPIYASTTRNSVIFVKKLKVFIIFFWWLKPNR